MSTPLWLAWAREIQAIAQSGLAFTENGYDRERYEALRALAARIVAGYSDAEPAGIEALFAGQAGYATPKVDVRGAAFNAAGELLLVREVADGGRWTLPGGWADVNLTASENVIKEVIEESGFNVRVRKLAAVLDRDRQGHHPPLAFSTYKMFFICDIIGGAAATSLETSEAAFFAERALPGDLSQGRVLPGQLRRMFEHYRSPGLPTDFD
jgi:ADP-ribose pyrophosphatase YjhB (NUDIX family)